MRTYGNKQINKNSIAIVCEGTDTEPNYFNEIKKELEKSGSPLRLTIVPGDEEEIPIEKKRGRNSRVLKGGKPLYQYHQLCEEGDNAERLYNEYHSQPLRYVREAQLYIERGLANEAWAVYDMDVHNEEDDEKAWKMQNGTLHIALSSYSIEEWFLLHFERNGKAFHHSDCKNREDKYICCGTGHNEGDCHGEECIAGVLREKDYIKDFAKSQKDLFSLYTLPQLDTRKFVYPPCFINAVWSRSLQSDSPEYQRNPFCTVDYLVARLFDRNTIQSAISVFGSETEVKLRGTKLLIKILDTNNVEVCNTDNKIAVIRDGDIKWFEYQNNKFTEKQGGGVRNINPQERLSIPFTDDANLIIVEEKEKPLVAVFKP